MKYDKIKILLDNNTAEIGMIKLNWMVYILHTTISSDVTKDNHAFNETTYNPLQKKTP
jgi:hypothetical protein